MHIPQRVIFFFGGAIIGLALLAFLVLSRGGASDEALAANGGSSRASPTAPGGSATTPGVLGATSTAALANSRAASATQVAPAAATAAGATLTSTARPSAAATSTPTPLPVEIVLVTRTVNLLPLSIGEISYDSERIDCPRGTKPVGGGFSMPALAPVWLESTRPDLQSWLFKVASRSNQGGIVLLEAYCAVNLGGDLYFASFHADPSIGDGVLVQALCPSGQAVLTAGLEMSPGEAYVQALVPFIKGDAGTSGSNERVSFKGNNPIGVSAFALCSAGVETVIVESFAKVPYATGSQSSTGTVSAFCPAGSVVAGGGFNFPNQNTELQRVTYAERDANLNSWKVVARNTSIAELTLTAYAICILN